MRRHSLDKPTNESLERRWEKASKEIAGIDNVISVLVVAASQQARWTAGSRW